MKVIESMKNSELVKKISSSKPVVYIKKVLSRMNAFLSRRPIIFCVIWSLCMNFIIETASRHSIIEGIIHIFDSYCLVFIYNSVIVFSMAVFCLLFKRRMFALFLITLPITILGIANGVVLTYRSTPIAACEFIQLHTVFGVFGLYVKWYVVLLAVVGITAIVTILVKLYKKCRRDERAWKKFLISCPVTFLILVLVTPLLVKVGVLSKRFDNLPDAYSDYGFVYCFSLSAIDLGISRPDDYSEALVDNVLESINAYENKVPEEKPNVIFLQLESFIDPALINIAEFSKDPTPNFNELKKNYPSAYLVVPYVGAGTANVEFEILSGMSLDFFGPGEYPYKTVLQDTACESMAYNFRELGYTSSAVHNHNGLFYDRAHVFSSLGFDKYISLELMQNVNYNPMEWACDDVLTSVITETLDASENQDFIYAIGVQTHGSYPDTPPDGWSAPIDATLKTKDTEVDENSLEYYASQLYEVDAFLKEFIDTLEARDEKTVLVVYGDHMPYIGLVKDEYTHGDEYRTEYVIWSNFEFPYEVETGDVYTYELAANIFKRLGMNNGILTKFHHTYDGDEKCDEYLEILQYDMLYGPRECYKKLPEPVATDIQMGNYLPVVYEVVNTEDGALVTGEHFTPFSKVWVNDDKEKTKFIDNNTLLLPEIDAVYGDVIEVCQTNGSRYVFSNGEKFVVDMTADQIPYIKK